MSTALRVLYVEDSEDDARLVMRELQKCGREIVWKRVDTAEALRTALAEQAWDVILSDHSMPDLDSLAALRIYKEKGLDIPFILITGSIGDEKAVEVLKAGAHDYLLKDKLTRLCAAVERELDEAEVRRQHRRAEEQVRINRAGPKPCFAWPSGSTPNSTPRPF